MWVFWTGAAPIRDLFSHLPIVHILPAGDRDKHIAMDEQADAPQKSRSRRAAGATMRGTGHLVRIFTKLTLLVLVLAMGLFVGGFFRFANTVAQSTPPQNPVETQAVVALTGGSSRIAQALDLVEKAKSKRLLITGVDEKTSMNALKALNESQRATFDCCVEVERAALDTVGNAVETGKWMAANQFNSITLVTSDYHMPRSLLEFRRQMPEATIQPFPVKLPRLQAQDWYTDGETLRFMVSEYIKYVGALSRDYLNSDTLKTLRASVGGA